MSSRKDEYTTIINEFLSEIQTPLLFVFATGSYHTDMLTEYSDIDLFLVTEQRIPRSRGVVFRHGIKISYFQNPFDLVERLIKTEAQEFKRPTCEILTHSDILFDRGGASALATAARRALLSQGPPLTFEETNYYGWKLYDKSLILNTSSGDIAVARYLLHDLNTFAIELFFRIHRMYKPHPKYVLARISEIDPQFARLVRDYLTEQNNECLLKMISLLYILLNFTPVSSLRAPVAA